MEYTMKGTIRRRYSLAVSVLYVVAGLIIGGRSLAAGVWPLIILGLVFIALGAVRIREYLIWRRAVGGF
jgi:hypothetical protein